MSRLIDAVRARPAAEKPTPTQSSARRFVVIDCETTGLSPAGGDRMVSFAAIELAEATPTGRCLSLIFNPGRKSNPHALRVHGLPDHLLRHQDPFHSVAQDIRGFLDGAVLVGHNVGFDIDFLRHEFQLCGLPWGPPQSVCTMHHARGQVAGRVSLDAVATLFGIDVGIRARFHGAFVDAEITSRLFQKMILGSAEMLAVPHLAPTNQIDPPPVVRAPAVPITHGIGGHAFAVTGELTGLSREAVMARILALGGRWHHSVRKDTDYLVVGHAPGATKLDTAAARRAKYGKPDIIDEAQFFAMIAASRAGKRA
ncbi:exonuclease domain-containing protein [Azospirillum sp. Sh1]|uniref:exonuclease domain-containing protein n=1 Tax=Azospirillum sp. Sh1 TaxID=2607285 RepID=UPI0011EC7227|nr:exonuclease domain-containing protein [Azospirillum sp. Sh1]KAA0573236.1 DNA-directed DNA polymerase [Azospirillum sp. Sh1]